MSLETTASSPTLPPTLEPMQKLRPWLLAIGICLVLMPLLQGYLALQPYLALAPFMPTSFVVEQIIENLKWGHAAFLAGGAMLIGGLLLALNIRKAGWVLAMIGIGFSVIWTVEILIFAIVTVAKSPDQFAPMMEIGLELMGMTYFLPVIFFVLQWIFLIFLLRGKMRAALQVERKHLLIAGGLLLLLLIDLHLSLLYTFMINQ